MEVAGGRSPPASSEAPMWQSGAECIPAGCIHRTTLPARTPAARKALLRQRAAGLAAGSCLLGFAGAKMAMVGRGTVYGRSRRGVPSPASSFAWPLWLAAARKQRLLSGC